VAGRRPLGCSGRVSAFSKPVALDGPTGNRSNAAERQPDERLSKDPPRTDEPDQEKRHGDYEPYLPVIDGLPSEKSLNRTGVTGSVIRAGHEATV
jgi:hypothetical protein